MLYLNGTPLNVTIFPDNTSQVWQLPKNLIDHGNYFSIKWEYSHEGEIMQIAQLKMLLESKGHRSRLKIKYLPYARQDKPVSNDATFALHAFAAVLNSLKFEEVIIVDPHSSVALDVIHNSRAEYPTEMIYELIHQNICGLACYPDKGAVTKYSKVYKELIGSAYVFGEKVRDQSTGHITSYQLIGNVRNETVLIIDDICDGGMTFKLLAKDLLAAGAREVNLFVTHGIFSKGLKTLKDAGINRIFTQDGEAVEVQNQITYRRL